MAVWRMPSRFTEAVLAVETDAALVLFAEYSVTSIPAKTIVHRTHLVTVSLLTGLEGLTQLISSCDWLLTLNALVLTRYSLSAVITQIEDCSNDSRTTRGLGTPGLLCLWWLRMTNVYLTSLANILFMSNKWID